MSLASSYPRLVIQQCQSWRSRQSWRAWAELIPSAPPAMKLLLGLLVIDLVFVGVFVFYGVHQVISDHPTKFPQIWSLASDHSIPEFFGYAKLTLAAVFLFIAFRKQKHLIWWSWSIIFGLLALDDMLQLHEQGGHWIASLVPVSSIGGIDLHHYGELAIYALLGAIALTVLLKGLLRTPAHIVAQSGFFLVVAAGLVVCGIGIDLISSASYFQDTDNSTTVSKIIYGALIILEDGGEALFMTLGCAGAYAIWSGSRINPAD